MKKFYSKHLFFRFLLIFSIVITSIITEGKVIKENIFSITFAHSYLNNNIEFSPAMAFDGNMNTAWAIKNTSKDKKFAVGIWYAQALDIKKLGITPGFLSTNNQNGNLFKANCRIKKLKISFNCYPPRRKECKKVVALFKDEPRMQYFSINCKKVDFIEFEILEVYSGEKNDAIYISEIDIVPNMRIIKKKNYYNDLINTHCSFIQGGLTLKSNYILIGGVRSGDEVKIQGTWHLTGNQIGINYNILKKNKFGQFEKSKQYNDKIFIKGILENGNMLIFGNSLEGITRLVGSEW